MNRRGSIATIVAAEDPSLLTLAQREGGRAAAAAKQLRSPTMTPQEAAATAHRLSVKTIDPLTLRFVHIQENRYAPAGENSTPEEKKAGTVNKDLEDGFLSEYYHRFVRRIQYGMITAVIIWALFIINDVQKNAAGERRNYTLTVIIRFINCAIGLLGAGLISLHCVKRHHFMTPIVGFVMICFGVAQIIFGMWDSNELDPAYSAFMILVPSTASTLFKQRFVFTVFYQALILVLYLCITSAFDSFHSFSDLVLTAIGLFIANCFFAAHAYGMELRMRKDYLVQRQLLLEENRSQDLLSRMLPSTVIERLRSGDNFIYYKHQDATLLFIHIHDFDVHVHHMSAFHVIRLLNTLFTLFDDLTDPHGVYKVETVGDAYLVSSGCPLEYARKDHTEAIAGFALEVRVAAQTVLVEYVEEVPAVASPSGGSPTSSSPSSPQEKTPNTPAAKIIKLVPLSLRQGIHKGGLISGVVGASYPRYRLMGDTVNTASRMSTTAREGQIQLSQMAFDALDPHHFIANPRGEIPVKGKGNMKVYELVAKIEHQCPLPKPIQQVRMENGSLNEEKERKEKSQRDLFGYPSFSDTSSPSSPTNAISPSLKGDSPADEWRRLAAPHASPPTAPAGNKRSIVPPSDAHSPIAKLLHSHHDAHHTPPDVAHPSPAHPPGLNRSGSLARTTVEMRPADLPGVPEMLDKLRSGKLATHEEEDEMVTIASSTGTKPLATSSSTAPAPPSNSSSSTTTSAWSSAGGTGMIQLPPRMSRRASGSVVRKTSPSNSPRKEGAAPAPVTTVAVQAAGEDKNENAGESIPALDAPPSLGSAPSLLHPPTLTNPPSVSLLSPPPSSSPPPGAMSLSSAATALVVMNRVVITAESHMAAQRGVAARPFGFGSIKNILRPTRSWWGLLGQEFSADEELEKEFQLFYSLACCHTKQNWVNGAWILLLPLSIYDTMNNADSGAIVVGVAWIFRLVGISMGAFYWAIMSKVIKGKLAVYLMRNSQLLVSLTVGLIAASFIATTGETSAIGKAYGVCFTLMALCVTCMFVGLLFYAALGTVIFLLLFWIGTALVATSGVPGIFALLAAGAGLYVEAAWNLEEETRIDFVRFRKLFHEQLSTRALVDHMLPRAVFAALQSAETERRGGLVANIFHDADVLFSDVVGFTTLASSMKPEDVVAVLNTMFSTFDEYSRKHNVYKVETIGDAYVACTNVVESRPDHTRLLVDFALSMQRAVSHMLTSEGKQIIIRIGIHTGPVIAGVVGKKMPRYHLFGETVTIAEEMEQRGIPGAVCLSSSSYETMPPGSLWEYECKSLAPVEFNGVSIARWSIAPNPSASKKAAAAAGSTAVAVKSKSPPPLPMPAPKTRRNSLKLQIGNTVGQQKLNTTAAAASDGARGSTPQHSPGGGRTGGGVPSTPNTSTTPGGGKRQGQVSRSESPRGAAAALVPPLSPANIPDGASSVVGGGGSPRLPGALPAVPQGDIIVAGLYQDEPQPLARQRTGDSHAAPTTPGTSSAGSDLASKVSPALEAYLRAQASNAQAITPNTAPGNSRRRSIGRAIRDKDGPGPEPATSSPHTSQHPSPQHATAVVYHLPGEEETKSSSHIHVHQTNGHHLHVQTTSPSKGRPQHGTVEYEPHTPAPGVGGAGRKEEEKTHSPAGHTQQQNHGHASSSTASSQPSAALARQSSSSTTHAPLRSPSLTLPGVEPPSPNPVRITARRSPAHTPIRAASIVGHGTPPLDLGDSNKTHPVTIPESPSPPADAAPLTLSVSPPSATHTLHPSDDRPPVAGRQGSLKSHAPVPLGTHTSVPHHKPIREPFTPAPGK